MSNEPEFVRLGPEDNPSKTQEEIPLGTSSIQVVPSTDDLRVAFFGNVVPDPTDPIPAHTDKIFSVLQPPAEVYALPVTTTNIPATITNPVYYEHDVVLNEDDILETRCTFKSCNFQSSVKNAMSDHVRLYHASADGAGSSKPKEFQCDLCQMKFTVFANMQRHRMSHLGVRPFECKVCSKKFTRNAHLMEHIVRQHSKQRPYKCPFCSKSFSVRPSLKNHLASDHSGIPKDKVCRVCGFRASTVGGAKIHYTNTHLRNGAESTVTTDAAAAVMDQDEDIELSGVPPFEFAVQELPVPTSTASEPCGELSSFRRYTQASTPMLHLTSNILRTNVSSSSFRDTSDVALHCSSSNLKQEPVDMDDSRNSCSSSVGTQPTSTIMEVSERHEDDEAGTSGFRQVNNSGTGSDEESVPPRPARLDRKPILSTYPMSSKYPDWRHSSPVDRATLRDQGESKVTTSVVIPPRNAQPQANQQGAREEEEDPAANRDRKPPPASLEQQQDSKANVMALVNDAGGSRTDQATTGTSECQHCGIVFPDSTLYFLHRGLHSDSNPWKCNYCGEQCSNKYDFYAHVIRKEHN